MPPWRMGMHNEHSAIHSSNSLQKTACLSRSLVEQTFLLRRGSGLALWGGFALISKLPRTKMWSVSQWALWYDREMFLELRFCRLVMMKSIWCHCFERGWNHETLCWYFSLKKWFLLQSSSEDQSSSNLCQFSFIFPKPNRPTQEGKCSKFWLTRPLKSPRNITLSPSRTESSISEREREIHKMHTLLLLVFKRHKLI